MLLKKEQKEKPNFFIRTAENEVKAKSKTEFKNKDFQKATRKNSLFLSALAQFNGDISQKIQNWFRKNITIINAFGTQKLFSLFGIWIECIEKGTVLIIDELDASLHTLLTQELIKLFHTKTNQQGQLIFAVHDTNLLTGKIFRRD